MTLAFNHGKAAVIKLDNAGGALTDISAYVTNVGFPEKADTAEVTALGATSKSYLSGLKDATVSLEGKWDPTLDAIMASALGASASKSFEYGPAGTTSGYVKYSGECVCTSYEISAGLDGAVSWSAELQVSGDVTRGTWT